MASAETGLELRSLIRKSGELEISLLRVPVAEPAADEVVVRMEATPINPSDLGLLLGPVNVKAAKFSGTGDKAMVTATIADGPLKSIASRFDQSMPVGNEGAGVVVKAGASAAAQALLGKTVSLIGGGMYTQFRSMKAAECLVLPAGTTAAEGASWFVNPLTALSMVTTMRLEGHKALVHTAAASNLGQMLNKICLKDGVDLVNIVRNDEQVKILKGLGAKYICDSSTPTFIDDLVAALVATGATIAFDAIGGGRLVSQILSSMEAAANQSATGYSRYGSTAHKQVYIYGGLDTSPTELTRGYGMAWGIGGYLVSAFLTKVGNVEAQKLRERVAAELKTTFASHYTKVISLQEALQPDVMAAYARRATGEKYLINPNKA